MSMFRDRDADLSGIRLLVVRVKEPTRRHELSEDEWAMAVLAYALEQSEDAALLGEEGLGIYADFVRLASSATRAASLTQLSRFITQRRGEGWRALLLYAMGEQGALSSRAASLAVSLARPTAQVRFSGIDAVVRLLALPSAPAAMLSAVLGLSDLRFLSLLEPLYSLPQPRWQALLAELSGSVNSLSAACLLSLAEKRPELAEDIVRAFIRLAAHTAEQGGLVADIVFPLPTWEYEQPAPQPLHAWTLAEFFPRMLSVLEPVLSAEQLHRLRLAFA